MIRSFAILAATAAVALPAAAFADAAFPPPSGWSHVDVAATDPAHTIQQWHIAGDVSSLTYAKDTGTSYADALARIQKNFADNKIRPAKDKDMPCQGKTAHVIEFATGPDGHQVVINRLLVPDAAGVDTVTYVRSDGAVFDADVQKSIAAYCAAT